MTESGLAPVCFAKESVFQKSVSATEERIQLPGQVDTLWSVFKSRLVKLWNDNSQPLTYCAKSCKQKSGLSEFCLAPLHLTFGLTFSADFGVSPWLSPVWSIHHGCPNTPRSSGPRAHPLPPVRPTLSIRWPSNGMFTGEQPKPDPTCLSTLNNCTCGPNRNWKGRFPVTLR